FSLRRGGRDIYALDISNPDKPSFLWKIKGGEGVFSELGETWSVPLVSVIPGYSYDHDADAGTPMMPKKVLIFGAGYDNNKDTAGVGTADSMGRGIFIVDATTGKLVRSITPDKETQQNIQVEGLIHSVPSQLNALDSNGDGITDRLYFGDTGGNLWRVDMPGNTLHGATTADGTTASWHVTLLASINGGTTSTDRRFFNTPDVVRSKSKVCKEYQRTATDEFCISAASIKYDAILIGTGDRTNPTATDVNNHFYMFRDMQLSPYSNESPDAQACSAAKSAIPPGVVDFRCYLPLGIEQLYNATSNIIQTGTKGQIDVASKVLDNSKGWFIDLSAEGEKSLSRAITLDGSVFFTSYSYSKADRTNSETCGAASGMSRLYQIDLQNASARGDFEDEDPSERSTFLGAMIAEIPSLHFGMDNKIRLLSTSGNSIKVFKSGAKIPQPYGIYWYRGE
ncbi:MAG: hypothetical protein GY781_02735, partial [Gammaproteobacteria bacterium]|nr:hypothetical protein [Gammaproteobacteria bacterium]